MDAPVKASGPKRRNRRLTPKLSGGGPVPRTGKQRALLALKWGAISAIVLAALAAASLATVFWYYGRDPNLPNIRSLGDYHPLQVTRVAASDGTLIGEVFTERRTYLPYSEIPEVIVHAVISAEDNRFFEHGGIDYWGMFRAVIVNLRSGKKKQGASTITQQVVKTFVLSPERTFKRKIQEIILARRLEGTLSKEDILTLYLNQIYFGHGRYGIQEASRYYFGKEVKDINAGEAAMLAGLPQAPENISPKKPQNQDRAKLRQTYVLEQMVRNGYLDEAEAKKWIADPIRIVGEPFPSMGIAPEWVEVAKAQAIATAGADKLDSLGTVVTTTVDLEVQAKAVEALRQGLRDVDARRKFGVAVRKIKKDKVDLELAKLGKRIPDGGPKVGEVYEALVRTVSDKNGELVVAMGKHVAAIVLGGEHDKRLNPDGKDPSERFSEGDIIRVTKLKQPPAEEARPTSAENQMWLAHGPEGAVVVLDPKNRAVLAMVGGYDLKIADFNRATMAKRQPGSTFKPFVYAAAVDTGEFTAATVINDAPEVYDLWKPENYKKGAFEGPVRLRHALARSINTVAIRVLHDVGAERVVEYVHRMGIQSELPTTLSLALGSGEVTPMELTNAFATFAAGGKAAPPVFVTKLGDQSLAVPPPDDAMRPEVAYVLTEMMRSVVDEGTAGKAKVLKMPIAGKTGTSNDVRDAWFVGMTPDLVIGVWVGFDDNTSLGHGESGGSTALPVFINLVKALKLKPKSFPRPAGVVEAVIDRASGKLAPEGAKSETTFTEVFLEGTAPTERAIAAGDVDVSTFVTDQYDDLYPDDPPPEESP